MWYVVTRDHNCGQSIMARSPRIGAPQPPGSQNPWPEVSFMMWVAIASCNSSETREKASRHISHTSWASSQSHMPHIGPAHPSTVSKAHRTWFVVNIMYSNSIWTVSTICVTFGTFPPFFSFFIIQVKRPFWPLPSLKMSLCPLPPLTTPNSQTIAAPPPHLLIQPLPLSLHTELC